MESQRDVGFVVVVVGFVLILATIRRLHLVFRNDLSVSQKPWPVIFICSRAWMNYLLWEDMSVWVVFCMMHVPSLAAHRQGIPFFELSLGLYIW